jgi:hypothetical protein
VRHTVRTEGKVGELQLIIAIESVKWTVKNPGRHSQASE